MESEFPSNSRKQRVKVEVNSKAGEKKVEKVITGEVIQRKKPLSKRFMETFFGGDTKSVGSYVVLDVLIPAAKDMVADAVSQGVERTLFGEARSVGRRTGTRPGSSSYTSYNRYSATGGGPLGRRDEPRTMSRRARATHDLGEIILATRAEANEVLDQLYAIVSQYETVTVADLYESVGVTPNFADEKWGWTDIRNARVTRITNGYLLDLPQPEPLD